MSWDEIIKGTNGSDVINGGSGDDFIQGRAGGDFLDGGDGNDQLQGNEGDDYIRGGAGNDFIHGGTGTDSAIYSGSVKDYTFRRNGEEFFVNHVGGSMIDGYDRLISIERLVFADAVIDLTQNNAPIAFDDSRSTDEDHSVSGNVLANDFDWEGNPLTATPGNFNGVYGSLTLNANGTYTYTPYASTQALALGQNVTDSFTYTVSDGSLSDTGTLTITVAGRNDAPVANPDSASTGENSPVTVNVLANDTDVDNGAVLTVTAASAPAGQGSASVVANKVVFNPGTDFDHLDTGETASVVVSYTITDEHGATSSSTVTITVNGANDAPVANDDVASTGEDGSASGNVLANDTDVDGEPLTVANPGVYAGAYGTLTINADGSYTYVPGAAAQGLDDGETAQDVFTYAASDGTASDSATLTVTLSGSNDAPSANDDSASTGEDNPVSGNVLGNDTDVDGEALTVANPGTYNGTYGTLTLNADGSYTYTPNALAQDLDAGDSAQDVFTYTASDGTVTDTATLTVTVNGADDGPQTVWYIDNSAVGSTNEGTQANPFTSIAAFNAAQGGVDGPQEGATVYLLQGTGTYAEPDGINLLDGQILIGVGQPVIAPLAGNGIDLADDNNVSGVDIAVSAGNVGIQDDGSSVGNLVVSDVAISGAGQIVDLDTGGTLDVTLNSAASTASSGGAIDLAGVGGSFTVTGATTIVGAHGGGGIDITGSSVAATFAGGGNVATGTATAVNYVGNSGSLALGGGFDILTTGGAGLNASGGGTVTVTGAGNSIASTTGTALSVSNTAIGAAGLTFESISSNGAANGIVLANTGTVAGVNGGLTVTGDGGSSANGSGGTIAASTGAGISLSNTRDVSLDQVVVKDGGSDGINGVNIVNFALTNASILDNGNSDEEHGIDLTGLTGTAVIDGTTVRGSFENNFELSNSSGILDSLIIADSVFDHLAVQSGPEGGNGIFIDLSGTAAITDLAIADSTFRNNYSTAILINTAGNSRIGADNATSGSTDGAIIADNVFDDNNTAVQVGVFGSSDVTVDIQGNSIVNDGRTAVGGSGGTSTAIVLGTSAGSLAGSTLNARVEDNVIGDEAIAGSGSSVGSGISLVIQGLADVTALIDGNTIREAPLGFGIEVQSLGASAGTPPASDVTITNNDVDHTNADFFPGASDFPLPAIWVYGDNVGTAGRLNLDVRGNTVPTDPSYFFTGAMIEVYENGGDIHLVDNPFGPPGQTASEQLESTNFGTAAAGPGVDLDLSGSLMQPPDLFWA
jgi:VCBS repeat-containing protein